MIKDILKEANRYDDVMGIIESIILNTESRSYPVDAYINDEGETRWRVDGDLIKYEAVKLLKTISEGSEHETIGKDFMNLEQYVLSHSNMLLHNYAVSISHRKEPETDIDVIRVWEILDNLLINWSGDGIDDWYIPNGWKKID